ncbi:DUF1294 domain-containing protein [Lysobacter sp. S4-A87]|uniref:DUF1294 domain-containing protein n=1 Tax=Lysobacter sp. S4-A87 TaxID=2925843 RepID=UPI001F530B6F|nr:DUF1294 domain-containing protein [Lysobacter sp. S4-A87]UNK50776.1 DUF1294 domain-containing protein [Lysobacter sp. S4-A87]
MTVLVYGYDKAIAGGRRRRIPERTLLGMALCGGTPGALLAMWLFRHKTAKQSFRKWLALVIVAQLSAAIALVALTR